MHFSLMPTHMYLLARNGLVNQVEFLGLIVEPSITDTIGNQHFCPL